MGSVHIWGAFMVVASGAACMRQGWHADEAVSLSKMETTNSPLLGSSATPGMHAAPAFREVLLSSRYQSP